MRTIRRRGPRDRAAVLTGLLLAGVPLASRAAPPEQETKVYLTPDEALRLAYPAADSFAVEPVVVTPTLAAALEERLGERFPFERVEVHHARAAGAELGRAVVTEEIGKYRPITFLVAFDPGGAIRRIELLAFRELYGDEVRSRAFLEQYEGKRLGDSLRVGRAITSIAGATLSARAISKGAHRMRLFLSLLDAERARAAAAAP